MSTFSALLLLISGTSFTRRFQRMYRAAYEREKAGIRSGVYSTLGLVVLLVEMFVLYGARAVVEYLPLSWLITLPFAIVTGCILWTSIPYLLLNRQVHWRRLVFGGLVAAISTAVYSFISTIYMPDTMERYTQEFGLFGVTIALIGWLLAVAFILVGSAAVGAQFDFCLAPWALAIKTRFKLEDPDILAARAHRGGPDGRDDHRRHPPRDPGDRGLGDPHRRGLGRHDGGAGDRRPRWVLGLRRASRCCWASSVPCSVRCRGSCRCPSRSWSSPPSRS